MDEAGGGAMVWGCRSIGRVGSGLGVTSRWTGNFRDAELGFGLVQSVGGATRRLDEGKRM